MKMISSSDYTNICEKLEKLKEKRGCPREKLATLGINIPRCHCPIPAADVSLAFKDMILPAMPRALSFFASVRTKSRSNQSNLIRSQVTPHYYQSTNIRILKYSCAQLFNLIINRFRFTSPSVNKPCMHYPLSRVTTRLRHVSLSVGMK